MFFSLSAFIIIIFSIFAFGLEKAVKRNKSNQKNMAEELVPIQENDYKEILLQTVAVIEHARVKVVSHIAAAASNTYLEI